MKKRILTLSALAVLLFFPGGQANACSPKPRLPEEIKDATSWFYLGSSSIAGYYHPNLQSDYSQIHLGPGSGSSCGPMTLYIKKDTAPLAIGTVSVIFIGALLLLFRLSRSKRK